MLKTSNRLRLAALMACVVLTVPLASAEDADDQWAPVRFLLGTWQGGGEASSVTHTYEFVLQGKFIHSRTLSVAQPGEGEASGEVHEDWGFFSYDPARATIVFRQFLSEGFVNTYVLGPVEPPGDTLVFTSESTEGAGGTQARLTFHRNRPDTYETLLDLASPGKDFVTCQKLLMKRHSD